MNPMQRVKKIDEVLRNNWFYLWDINDKIPSVSYFGSKGAFLDIIALKEIIKHAESLTISLNENRLYVWIRVKGKMKFITHKYYCEAHDRYFIDSFNLKFHMNLNEGCRIKVIG